MSKNDDGGSAFPGRASGHVQESRGSGDNNLRFELSGGMSLRDWFAGQALVGATSSVMACSTHAFAGIADNCYAMADAMLKARER